jgi:transcriptional regulator with XRE-family HTH domain
MLKNLITKFRECKGVSKSQLARKIGRCASYVTRLENNDIEPSGNVMFRLAEYFKCKVDDLFRYLPDKAKALTVLKQKLPICQLADLIATKGKPTFDSSATLAISEPISRRASAHAGESNNTAGINKHNERKDKSV